MNGYDAVVLGAGVEGLAAAARLGQAGRRVVVLESREHPGGPAAMEEFHPGYHAPGVLHDTAGVRRGVADSLGLPGHGLAFRESALAVYGPAVDGGIWVHPDPGRCAALGPEGPAYQEHRSFLRRVGPVLRRVLDAPPPDLALGGARGMLQALRAGFSLRRLGRGDMLELARVLPTCVADWLEERFGHDRLKAVLAAPALDGAFAGPWSAGTTALLLLREAAAGPGVAGGPAALVAALEKACTAAGVEIRTGARALRISVEHGRAAGVETAGGAAVRAGCVVSALGPKQTLLGLLPPGSLPDRTVERIAVFRTRGTTAVVRLALDGPLEFAGAAGRPVQAARTGGHLDDLERAFDPVKYGGLPERPHLDLHVPTLEQPALAPEGHHVVTMLVQHVPAAPAGGWTGPLRERLLQRVLAVLEEIAPGAGARVVGRQLLTPADLEARFGLTGGHLFHGEPGLDQLLSLRPAPECSRHATPLPGLFLGGPGCHPGGGPSLVPGTLAADAVLKARIPAPAGG